MTSIWYRRVVYCSVLLMFSGCMTTVPIGPRVAVMPAPGKPFEVFAAEEHLCRQYAEQSIGITPDSSASRNYAGTAVAGTAIGTAAGALLGGREGAPVGAGVGLIAGSAAGSNQAAYSSRDAQWSYDNAYTQCMYAKGNQIPGYHYQLQQQIPPPPPNTGYRQAVPYLPPPPPQQ
jgi:hypothetical protein